MSTSDPHRIDRRRFLTLAGFGATASGLFLAGCASDKHGRATTTIDVGTGAGTTGSSGSATKSTDATTAAPQPAGKSQSVNAAAKSKRRLVVIELDGGNDGMSTLVPFGISGYNDLRKRTAIDHKDLIEIDKQVALHQNLKGMHGKGLALLQGVGTANPDGSHFAMMERWWRGDIAGNAGLPTGFLGRLCDALADPAARVVGLSFGSGSHPAMQAARASTLSIPGAGSADYLVGADPNDKARSSFQQALADLGSGSGDGDTLALARRSERDAVGIATMLHGLDKEDKAPEYPGSTLANGLKVAARLLAADEHVRVIHVPMGADFDTHQNHPGRHPGLLTELNDAVVAFLNDLEGRGLRDQVLVATTSEFGRTAADNGSDGLDHGTASVAMLLGPVKAGVHGEHPSLTKLDDNSDLIATVNFDRYYATIAQSWFGIPASEVLPGNPLPIDGIINA